MPDDKKNNSQVYEPPKKNAQMNSIQMLIKESYDESIPTSPIYFLVTHSVNVYEELRIFYQEEAAPHGTKLHHY